MNKILVNGSIAYDVLLGFEGSFADAIDPDKLDKLAVSYFSPHYTREFGGTAGNIAWHIKLLGGEPVTVGTIGKDGDEYRELFSSAGINTQYIEQLQDHVTATAIIGSDSGERQISFFHPGADSHGKWPDLSDVADDIMYSISSPRDMQAMMQGVEWSKEHGVKAIFDPGQQVHMFGKDEMTRMLHMSEAIICNEYEWSIVQKTLECTEESILKFVPILIVTLAEDGVECFSRDGEIVVPACRADKMVNPTGAGDALRAGLLTALTAGESLENACRLGAAMGSIAVELDGTQIPFAKKDEVYQRVEETYGVDIQK